MLSILLSPLLASPVFIPRCSPAVPDTVSRTRQRSPPPGDAMSRWACGSPSRLDLVVKGEAGSNLISRRGLEVDEVGHWFLLRLVLVQISIL